MKTENSIVELLFVLSVFFSLMFLRELDTKNKWESAAQRLYAMNIEQKGYEAELESAVQICANHYMADNLYTRQDWNNEAFYAAVKSHIPKEACWNQNTHDYC
jgi:hypothetical protein